jgi:hypothetical protein
MTFIEHHDRIGPIGRLCIDFGANDTVYVGTGVLIRLKDDILGVLTTAHNFVQKKMAPNGEVKIIQAVDVEFYLGLDGSDNYTYKFHIYNFFVHPGYIRDAKSSS